ncbi:putative FMN-dependent luciferase-like monooxygenase [Klugiella xanthotipulae]|uniref:Putative FMN-dependent luciferase-like monooxygenase n=1 Tax=Klugiella xanthotipulae TaxID=244735 RepID=A0A543I5J7_9MICO|nr:putative FMN-dependent luciferase-like monooxygenase [Klugiella xanthotipulae]TQM65872.1 putative FMN-dependent luciferase-like monooxygenase [Klugiella xanthotipulae]
MTSPRLGYFSRLLDNVPAGERYRLATEQIRQAERVGFDTAWVAQHHFHEAEGGLPSPFVFLSHVAAHTSTIRLGTGVITLPLENAIRVAEDAAVLDLLSGGRLELGVGTGGTPSSFTAFGHDSAERSSIFGECFQTLLDAWSGTGINGTDNRLYPAAPQLRDRIWHSTFSTAGGTRAGSRGDGLLLSRTQPRTAENPDASLSDLQNPIIDGYLDALPAGATPRIMGSRTLFVADSREEARACAEAGLRAARKNFTTFGLRLESDDVDDLIAAFDAYVGTPEEVLEQISRDTALARVTDLAFQVHSIDPPHELILRSIELTASEVAPALGWRSPALTAAATV